MNNDLVVIIPTRGRPESIKEVIKSFEDTETKATLLLVLDDDDSKLGHYLELEVESVTVKRESVGFVAPLNYGAHINRNNYRHFCFLGDDNRPRTLHWDQQFVDVLDDLGTGVVYGNDLYQKEALPTAVALSGDIVRTMDAMVPRTLQHLYADNFWLRLGQDLGAIRYLPNVVVEHLHPVAGKAGWDDLYRAVNAPDMYDRDAKALNDYLASSAYAKLLENLKPSHQTDWKAIAKAHKEWIESGNAKTQGWWSI